MTPASSPTSSGLTLTPVTYGKAARDQLGEAIKAAKGDDPLAPVTVVVPTRLAGVELRRYFAAQPGGIAAVKFIELQGLADRWVMADMVKDGRRLVNDSIIGAAARRALEEIDGMFKPVADHPSTQAEFVRVFRELRSLDEPSLDRLASSTTRARDVVAVTRRIADVLAEHHYDDRGALDAARALVEGGGKQLDALLEATGELVVFLPKRLSGGEAGLISALGSVTDVTVLVGVTGIADAGVLQLASQLGCEQASLEEFANLVSPATLDEVLDVSDQDEEVRHVTRRVLADLDDGVPANEIAVFAPTHSTYSRILADHLNAAGVEWHGLAPQALGESITGRVAAGLLRLVDGELQRQDVFNLLSNGVLREEPFERGPVGDVSNRLVLVALWERLTRAAGVSGGDEWGERLTRYAGELRGQANSLAVGRDVDDDTDVDRLVQRKEREARDCEAIVEFMDELKGHLDAAKSKGNWQEVCGWFRGLLLRYLGVRFSGAPGSDDEDMPSNWPPEEKDAARRVKALLDELASLDEIEPSASVATLQAVLSTRLREPLRLQPGGSAGINVAPVEDSEFFMPRRAYVLGLAEGLYPKRLPPDSLIGEEERAALGGELMRVSEHVTSQHHSLLGVLAATESVGGTAVGVVPRGSLRRTSENVKSRWLAEVAPNGEPTSVPSFYSGVRAAEFPATAWERDAADMLRVGWKRWSKATDESVTKFVGAARDATSARRSSEFTRFDGNLAGVVLESDQLGGSASDGQIGPTTLEAWATCPRAYLFRYLLGVGPVEEPDEILTINALDYGHVVHSTLDDFARELIENERPPGPHFAYCLPGDAEKLAKLAEPHLQQLEAEGRTGYELPWRVSQAQIKDDLRMFCEKDEIRPERDEPRGTLIASEARFGKSRHWDDTDEPAADPVSYDLGDGRTILFRGSIDRVEQLDDGSLLVIDYKTGKPNYYEAITEESDKKRKADFTLSGTKLQLPVYALAAEARFGSGKLGKKQPDNTPASPTQAMYWFVTSRKGNWSTVVVPIDEVRLKRFQEVIGLIASGINDGVFIGKTEADSGGHGGHIPCAFCDPDGLGTAALRRDFVRKSKTTVSAIVQAREQSDTEDDTDEAGGSPSGLGLLWSLDVNLKELHDE